MTLTLAQILAAQTEHLARSTDPVWRETIPPKNRGGQVKSWL